MAGFVTVPERLFAARCELAAAVEQAADVLARVDAAARDVFEQSWTGAAATAAGTGYAEWRAGAEQVVAALQQMGDALERAGRDYAGAEAAGVAAFGRLLPAA